MVVGDGGGRAGLFRGGDEVGVLGDDDGPVEAPVVAVFDIVATSSGGGSKKLAARWVARLAVEILLFPSSSPPAGGTNQEGGEVVMGE